MIVGKINLSTQNSQKYVAFKEKGSSNEYENPISRDTERDLAILGSVGAGAVTGLFAGCLSSFLFKPGNKKFGILIGAAAGALSLLLTLPSNLYNTKVNAFVKQKEMDVFSRDRNLKANLTEEVDTEVKNPDVSLDKKLDDNLKLQMANRGGAIGIANITPQA